MITLFRNLCELFLCYSPGGIVISRRGILSVVVHRGMSNSNCNTQHCNILWVLIIILRIGKVECYSELGCWECVIEDMCTTLSLSLFKILLSDLALTFGDYCIKNQLRGG